MSHLKHPKKEELKFASFPSEREHLEKEKKTEIRQVIRKNLFINKANCENPRKMTTLDRKN